jgi:hypothetical protein
MERMRIWGKGTPATVVAVAAAVLTSAGTAAATGGDLWTYGSGGTGDTGRQVMAGTSPSIAGLAAGGDEVAYQSSEATLANYGTAGTGDLAVAMGAGTSPSIAGLETGGWQIAVSDSAYSLETIGDAGSQNFHDGVASPTNPSITGLVPNGYEIAFQDYGGNLWTAGTASAGNTNQGMWPGTAPGIAAAGNGFAMAFTANTLHLFSATQTTSADLGTTVASGTSPSIAQPSTGGYEIAYVNTAGHLALSGSLTNADSGLAVAPGSSPSIAPLQGGGYEVALHGSNGDLWVTGPSGTADTGLTMAPSTSPGIGGLAAGGYEAVIQAAPAPPATTVSTPVTTPVPDPPPVRGRRQVRVKILLKWTWHGRQTRLQGLVVRRFPARGTIRFLCRGRQCPHDALTASRRTLPRLKRALVGRVYRVGEVLYVWVTAKGYRADRVKITFRDGKQPVLRLL